MRSFGIFIFHEMLIRMDKSVDRMCTVHKREGNYIQSSGRKT
jgi:hypothetical protein